MNLLTGNDCLCATGGGSGGGGGGGADAPTATATSTVATTVATDGVAVTSSRAHKRVVHLFSPCF